MLNASRSFRRTCGTRTAARRRRRDHVTLVPEDGELAIVLRGDLGAILRFAAGKKYPDFLSEAEALDNLLAQSGSLRKPRLRNGKTSALNATEVS